jgi:hypothetical protein
MERLRILEQWNHFREKVISPVAPAIQIREMRRAFYAGAWAFYSIQMNHLARTDPEVISVDDLTMMRELDAELTAFNAKVKAGQA